MVKIIKNGGLFALLMCITGYFIFKDNNMTKMIEAIKGVNPLYIIFGMMLMALFITCEGMNIRRLLMLFHYKCSILSGIKYALVGFFFSSITPSASGGQPMQLYYMHRDEIKLSHGTLALLIELISFEVITISLSIFGLLVGGDQIFTSIGPIKYLVIVGVCVNLGVVVFLLIAVFSKSIMTKLVAFVVKLLKLFKYKNLCAFQKSMDNQLEEYRKSAVYIRKNKSLAIKTLITTLVQIVALHSVSFMVYKAFGLNEYGFIQVIAMQAVLYVAVSALPLPGAVGVSESSFMILFKTMFPAGSISSAMILSRGISFYLFVLVSGIMVACIAGISKNKTKEPKNKKRESYNGIYNSNC